MRGLLLLPAVVALALLAIGPFTAGRSFWRYGVCEFDVADADMLRPIEARVTMTCVGPLAGEKGGRM